VLVMTNLVQWDPFTELRSTMDRLFDQGFSRPWRLLPSSTFQAAFPVEVWETDEAVEVRAALPGVRPEDVDISVLEDVLTIKAEHREDAAADKRTYHRREISYGTYTRSLYLPVSVDVDKAEARYENGVLQLTLPKAESVRAKHIRVAAPAGDGGTA
jgi:HSP20 family protein